MQETLYNPINKIIKDVKENFKTAKSTLGIKPVKDKATLETRLTQINEFKWVDESQKVIGYVNFKEKKLSLFDKEDI